MGAITRFNMLITNLWFIGSFLDTGMDSLVMSIIGLMWAIATIISYKKEGGKDGY